MNHEAQGEVALSLRHFSKTFGGTRALVDLDLDILKGEIHGLVGRNGSGKSTLIKILSGYHDPDPGASLTIAGRAVHLPLPPARVRDAGLVFVHQDLALAPGCSVLENMRVGRYDVGAFSRVDWRAERHRVRRSLETVGLSLDPDTPASSLRPLERALVAIARALDATQGRHDGVLVLDEPTTFLPRADVDALFAAVRRIVAAGLSAVFVSHRVEEIKALTDRISVLRDGHLVATRPTAEIAPDDLIQLILGQPLADAYPDHVAAEGDVAMQVSGLSGTAARDVSFTCHHGEIIGVTGIAGMGQDELPYLLFGARTARGGTIQIGDHAPIPLSEMTPRRAIDLGLALLPSDRQGASGVQEFSVRENVSLPILDQFFHRLRFDHRRERTLVSALLRRFTVRPPEGEVLLQQLSGGNQQKALLAKWLQQQPPILLLDDPTQGVDVGARKDVFRYLEEAAEAGSVVMISSTEYEDLAHLCHRVLVFRDGGVAAELSGADLTEENIITACYRQTAA